MHYEDFAIRFEAKGGKKFKIRVESAAGNDSAVIELTHSVDELLSLVESMGQVVRGNAPASAAQDAGERTREAHFDEALAMQPTELGKVLYRDLFVGAAASKFDQALGSAQGRNVGLRIRLHIDPGEPEVAQLASLPWELLCHPDMGDQPLGLSTDTPVVRYLDSPRPLNLRPFVAPLRVLVVVSSPSGVAALDLEKETQSIKKSWAGQANVDVHFLHKATVEALTEELGRHDYHVLHYMGHGDFDEKKGVGVLLMETESGAQDAVDGRSFGVMLQNVSSLRLVLLNACNTAKLNRKNGGDAYGGVATSLVLTGVPAVIAMQFPISDQAAITFTGSLYTRLAQGHSIDGAVTEARKAIRLADRASLEWATPVLFMSTPNGRLFDEAEANRGAVSATTPHVPAGAAKEKKIPLAGIAAGVLAALLAAIAAWQFMGHGEKQLTVSGTVVDPTTNAGVSGATLKLAGTTTALGVTDAAGAFKVSIPARQVAGKEEVVLMMERDGYTMQSVNIPVDGKASASQALSLMPENLSGCTRQGEHLVMVGNFSAATSAQGARSLSDTFAKSLGSHLLPELQKDHLPQSVQPSFDTCTNAKPSNVDHSSRFAKALGVDVFVYGDVIGNGPFKVQTYLGDRYGVFDGTVRSSASENVDVSDPAFARLANSTQADILLALAGGYAAGGQFAECVSASVSAERLAGAASPAITKQRKLCMDKTGNARLLP